MIIRTGFPVDLDLKIIDLAIWEMVQPIASAASWAVRVELGNSSIITSIPAFSSAVLTRRVFLFGLSICRLYYLWFLSAELPGFYNLRRVNQHKYIKS